MVVLGVGVAPRTNLAKEAGLTVDNGIVVDENLRTSAAEIYAAGDVARARSALEPVCAVMRAAGSERLLLGCTELPLALADAPLDTVAIDATAALARAAVAWSLAARRRTPDKKTPQIDGHQMAGGLS